MLSERLDKRSVDRSIDSPFLTSRAEPTRIGGALVDVAAEFQPRLEVVRRVDAPRLAEFIAAVGVNARARSIPHVRHHRVEVGVLRLHQIAGMLAQMPSAERVGASRLLRAGASVRARRLEGRRGGGASQRSATTRIRTKAEKRESGCILAR